MMYLMPQDKDGGNRLVSSARPAAEEVLRPSTEQNSAKVVPKAPLPGTRVRPGVSSARWASPHGQNNPRLVTVSGWTWC